MSDTRISAPAFDINSPIVSAAMLMDDGLIVPGVRHFSPDMRAVLHRIYGDKYHHHVREQGFINTRGQFLNRRDGLHVARWHCQYRPLRDGREPDELFSENLY